MPLAEFETCRQRIERAYAHSVAFAETWNAFIKDDVYSPRLRIEDDGAGSLYAEPVYESLPSQLSIELGEFLYQLRAALDACVYGAAILESGQNPPPNEENLEFPICDSPDKFKKAGWHIEPLAGMRRRIIEDVQPYNAPKDLEPSLYVLNMNRTFAMLHNWARIDRHRKLHVVGSWGTRNDPKFRLPDGIELEWMMVTYDGFLEHDSLVATFKLGGYVPGAEVYANPDLFIDVTVDESPEPVADNDTLSNRMLFMRLFVKEVVRAIEQSFIDERKAGIGGSPVGGGV